MANVGWKIANNSVEIAEHLKHRLKPKTGRDREPSSVPPSYEQAIETRDEIADIEPLNMKIPPVTTNEMDELYHQMPSKAQWCFFVTTDAFQVLQHETRLFVFPTVQQFLEASIGGGLIARTQTLHIACRVQWEVEEFCR